ncbi:myo-inositol 2-dehydrogenase-like, partial [Saccoglossus kowalevskii]|uniref:Uncharacterized protein LOC102801641 n=1 Tax=Saccoglossus kowalevskii TaxID=10224 RepID=A0ABM0MEP4_SACKO
MLMIAFVFSGKHVFCEKPIGKSIASTQSCYEEAQKNNKVLLCAFNRRFDPGVRQVQQKSRNGVVGQIQHIKTISRDAPLPPLSFLKLSGGIFHDCAVHDIDVICWIMGDTPTTVYTQGHAFNPDIADMDDIDTVAITMKFASGAIGTIDLSRFAAYGYDQRLEVFGNKGMVQNHNSKFCDMSSHGTDGESSHPILPSFKERYAQAYQQELEHFLDTVTALLPSELTDRAVSI